MFSKRSRPSVLGRTAHTVARTAVIAGTASAVSGAVSKRQSGSRPAAPHATSEPASGLSAEAMEQLKKLAELRDAGILTDEEFATQKARILN